MKLKAKLLLISALFSVVAILFVAVILRSLVLSTYSRVEEDVFKQDMNSLSKNIVNEFARVETILSDWSNWDLTYAYVQGGEETYVDDNISLSVYPDLNISYMVIFDENYDLLYGAYYDKEDEGLHDIPADVLKEFLDYRGNTGILVIGDQMILFASQAVKDNEGEADGKGMMAFAKVIDTDFKLRIEEENGHTLEVHQVDKETLQELPNEIGYGSTSGFFYENGVGIGEINIPILNSDQFLQLRVVLGNEIQKLGQKYMNQGILYILAVLVIFSLLMYIALGQFVVKRIIILNSQVSKITNFKDSGERVTLSGVDELGELSTNINQMLNELESMHKEIEVYASFDEMTGTYNRRIGFDILEYLIDQKSDEFTFTIVFIDVNDLKKVNDLYGHNYGDQLLKDTISILKSAITVTNDIVRLGGDEFLVILPNCGSNKAYAVMNGVKEKIEAFNEQKHRKYTVSISYGISEYENNMKADAFVETADKKMYAAKRNYKENRQE